MATDNVFKSINENREVNRNRVNEIKESINKHGFLNNPIIVNEKCEIIDGQHRYTACKELGIEIPFVIAQNYGISDCRELNKNTANWKSTDYIKSYAKSGNENFIRLLRLVNKYPDINSATIRAIQRNKILMGASDGKTVAAIKNGSYVMSQSDSDDIEPTLKFLYENRELVHLVGGKIFNVHQVLAWLLRNGCSEEIMLEFLEYNKSLKIDDRCVLGDKLDRALSTFTKYYNNKSNLRKRRKLGVIDFGTRYLTVSKDRKNVCFK